MLTNRLLMRVSFSLLVLQVFYFHALAQDKPLQAKQQSRQTSQNGLSLQRAVEIAVRTHPLVKEAEANRRAVDKELDQAYGNMAPRVDLEGAFGPGQVSRTLSGGSTSSSTNDVQWAGRRIGVVMRYTLYDGDQRMNEIARQGARVGGAALRVYERAETLAIDTVQAYVDVVRHRKILALSQDNIAKHHELMRLLKTQFDGGSLSSGDLSMSQERLAEAEAARSDIMRALAGAEARFINLVGQKPGALGALPNPSGVPKTLAVALSQARKTHPSLRAAAADIESAQAQSAQASGSALPRLGVEGRATHGYDISGTKGRNNEVSARMTLGWTIFDGQVNAAREAEQVERVTEAQMRRDRIMRDVDEQVMRSFADVEASIQHQAAQARRVAAAEKTAASYGQEFTSGKRSLVDLLDATNAAFAARSGLVSSESVAIFSKWKLRSVTSGLLASLNIEAPADARGSVALPAGPLGIGRTIVEPLNRW